MVAKQLEEGGEKDALPASGLTSRDLVYTLSLCDPFCCIPNVVGPGPSCKASFEEFSFPGYPATSVFQGTATLMARVRGLEAIGTGCGLGLSSCASLALAGFVGARPGRGWGMSGLRGRVVGPGERVPSSPWSLFEAAKLHSPLLHRFPGCLLHTSPGVMAVRKQLCPRHER